MAIVLGLNAKLYIDVETGYMSPTWHEVKNVKDLTLKLEKNKADVTVRGNNGWRAYVAVLKDASPSWKMNYDTTDSNFTLIQQAFLASTTPSNELNVAIMDGDITTTGTQGLEGPFFVSSFTVNEPLEEALTVDVELAPAQVSGYTVSWVTIA